MVDELYTGGQTFLSNLLEKCFDVEYFTIHMQDLGRDVNMLHNHETIAIIIVYESGKSEIAIYDPLNSNLSEFHPAPNMREILAELVNESKIFKHFYTTPEGGIYHY